MTSVQGMLTLLGYKSCDLAMRWAEMYHSPQEAWADARASWLVRVLSDLGHTEVLDTVWEICPPTIKAIYNDKMWTGDRVAGLCITIEKQAGVEIADFIPSKYSIDLVLDGVRKCLESQAGRTAGSLG